MFYTERTEGEKDDREAWLTLLAEAYTAKKFGFMNSQKKELHGLSPNFHIHVSVSDLNIASVHLFFCSRIGRPIREIYKSLTETLMWELGL